MQQRVKWLVYSLLLINYALYFRDDLTIAAHTLRNGGSFFEWTAAFATTIDETAWLFLLILFELETYILDDEPLSRVKSILMHTIRVVCYVSLAHTLYAFSVYALDLQQVVVIEGITNLCQLVEKDVSYALNFHYTLLDASNCKILSTATQFYYLDPPNFLIVTDSTGLVIEKQLAWLDVFEVIAWFVILFTIESSIYLQDRGITTGVLTTVLNKAKFMFYTVLWGAIIYWLYREHWMYAWDEFLWIAGFAAIEMNVVAWRNELIETDDPVKNNSLKE
ncbi:hypothetical protein RI844_15465 [Thalassotalea fonticola]|uniref:Shikimate kinase n=1 Tax=Thalassotalea fonticola TaxID=3065649 RepID=A0ABZ0GMX2_9GAMM|nr:hypothetical protein RI844_15465 [Colwelliaceae bacterium S1-1]